MILLSNSGHSRCHGSSVVGQITSSGGSQKVKSGVDFEEQVGFPCVEIGMEEKYFKWRKPFEAHRLESKGHL